MKILFYVEPHALRDSFTSHSHPYKIFQNICRQIKHSSNSVAFEDIDVRIFSNHILQQVRFEETLDLWPLILTPTKAEQKSIEELATMWLPQGMQDWIDICTNSDSPITKFYTGILSRIKSSEFDFDVIVSWGQNQAIKDFSECNQIQTVYFELASMRPPFPLALLMDPIGVNGAASSTFLNVDTVKEFVRNVPSNVIFTALNDEFHPTKQSSNLFTSKYSPIQWKPFATEAPVALIPLQLVDDANLLLYSEFSSIEEFTDSAIQKLTEHGWNILIKPHPHAELRGGYVERAQQNALKKYEAIDHIQILREPVQNNEYLSLLSRVDLIITNNSSVGFEGLLCGTQCVTMGTACYSIQGGLPNLEQFLNAQHHERAEFKENASAIVTFMTSFMFPLERKIAHELIARIRLWKELTPPPIGDADTWVKSNLEQLGWGTWHEGSSIKRLFLKYSEDNHEDQGTLENA